MAAMENSGWKYVSICFSLLFFEALSHLPCGTVSEKLELSMKLFAYV
jgi:hypothetical protein